MKFIEKQIFIRKNNKRDVYKKKLPWNLRDTNEIHRKANIYKKNNYVINLSISNIFFATGQESSDYVPNLNL